MHAKTSVKRRVREPTKPTRTLGKSALQRNRQGPAFGRGEQTRQQALNLKHPQSLVLKLRPRGPLRRLIRHRPKTQCATLPRRTAKMKALSRFRRINLERNRRV